METAKFTTTEDKSIFDETLNDILGFGNEFPENPKDGFVFVLLTKKRKQKFIYDASNEVWQEIGNDSFEYGVAINENTRSLKKNVKNDAEDNNAYVVQIGGLKRTLIGVFSGLKSTYSHSINTNTGDVPAFYDIGCNGLGPFATDVDVYADGSADDDLFVFKGTNPYIYDQWPSLSDEIWYNYTGKGITHSYYNQKLCTVPAGNVFSIMLVDTCAVNVIWNGTITLKSDKTHIDLQQYVDENGYEYENYSLYGNSNDIDVLIGTYKKENLPILDLNDEGTTYKLYGTSCDERIEIVVPEDVNEWELLETFNSGALYKSTIEKVSSSGTYTGYKFRYIGLDKLGPYKKEAKISFSGYADNDFIVWSGGDIVNDGDFDDVFIRNGGSESTPMDSPIKQATDNEIRQILGSSNLTVYYNPMRHNTRHYGNLTNDHLTSRYQEITTIPENTVFGIRLFDEGAIYEATGVFMIETDNEAVDLSIYKTNEYKDYEFKIVVKNINDGSEHETKYGKNTELPDNISIEDGYEYKLFKRLNSERTS